MSYHTKVRVRPNSVGQMFCEGRKAGDIEFMQKVCLFLLLLLLLLLLTVQNEDSADRAEIFTEASHHALTQSFFWET